MPAKETVLAKLLPEHLQCVLLPLKRVASGSSVSNGFVNAVLDPEEQSKKKIKTAHSPSRTTHSPSRSPRISNRSVSVAVDSPKSLFDKKITNLESPTGSVTSLESSGCSQTAEEKIRSRDGNVCVLTGAAMPDVAPIFPLPAMTDRFAIGMFNGLFMFWGDETQKKWKAIFEDNELEQSPRNLLSLDKHLHYMWNRSFFALKPLSSTDRQVTVQFHWLKRINTRAASKKLLDFDTAMQVVCGGDTYNWGHPQLAYRPSGEPIETGQLFTIYANTPDQLPSLDLLQFQWDLRRIAAMCTDANVYEYRKEMGIETDFESDGGDLSENSSFASSGYESCDNHSLLQS